MVGVDIDIRAHNRAAIEGHPMCRRITMIEGSSIAPDVVAQVARAGGRQESVLVCLDSNHTHAHVLAELQAYAPMTTVGSYCVVFDTIVEDLPGDVPRPAVGRGRQPEDGGAQLPRDHPQFEIDHRVDAKLLITVAPTAISGVSVEPGAPGDGGLVYACLTHVPLTLDFPPWVVPIRLGAAQQEGDLNLRDLAPEWDAHHPQLGSTAGTFALARLVRERFPQATRVAICQYRKFVSRERISGVRDPRYRVWTSCPGRCSTVPGSPQRSGRQRPSSWSPRRAASRGCPGTGAAT